MVINPASLRSGTIRWMVESGSVHPQTTTRLIPTGIYTVKHPLTMRVSAYSRGSVKSSNFRCHWATLTRNSATSGGAGQRPVTCPWHATWSVHFTGTIVSLSLMFLGITKNRRARIAIGKPIEQPLFAFRISVLTASHKRKSRRIAASPQVASISLQMILSGNSQFLNIAHNCAPPNSPHWLILPVTARSWRAW